MCTPFCQNYWRTREGPICWEQNTFETAEHLSWMAKMTECRLSTNRAPWKKPQLSPSSGDQTWWAKKNSNDKALLPSLWVTDVSTYLFVHQSTDAMEENKRVILNLCCPVITVLYGLQQFLTFIPIVFSIAQTFLNYNSTSSAFQCILEYMWGSIINRYYSSYKLCLFLVLQK